MPTKVRSKKSNGSKNRALRVCTLSNRYTSNLNLHKACTVLPHLDLRCKLDLLVLMYKLIRCGLEVVIPARDTRQSSAPLLAICRPKTRRFLNSLSYLGLQVWNMLAARVRQLNEFGHFKTAIRSEIDLLGIQ